MPRYGCNCYKLESLLLLGLLTPRKKGDYGKTGLRSVEQLDLRRFAHLLALELTSDGTGNKGGGVHIGEETTGVGLDLAGGQHNNQRMCECNPCKYRT